MLMKKAKNNKNTNYDKELKAVLQTEKERILQRDDSESEDEVNEVSNDDQDKSDNKTISLSRMIKNIEQGKIKMDKKRKRKRVKYTLYY